MKDKIRWNDLILFFQTSKSTYHIKVATIVENSREILFYPDTFSRTQVFWRGEILLDNWGRSS